MAQQGRPRIARIGDRFSYSDIAARRMFGDSAGVDVMGGLGECLEAARDSRHAIAVVPVHNTENGDICGAGGVSLADMARGMGLRVHSKLEIPVDHVLASFGGLEGITAVYSKDVALGQCSKFIELHGMRQAFTIPGMSAQLDTASAARYVAKRRVPYIAAICSEEAAAHYGVPVVRRSIANSANNRTTFHAYVRADSAVPAPARG